MNRILSPHLLTFLASAGKAQTWIQNYKAPDLVGEEEIFDISPSVRQALPDLLFKSLRAAIRGVVLTRAAARLQVSGSGSKDDDLPVFQ
jgi:hypothetical protein